MIDIVNHDVWEVKNFLTSCAESHSKAKVEDYVKHLYQSEFGGGHMVQDEAASLKRLREEIDGLNERQKRQPHFSPLCGDFCRMNLSVSQKLSPETINRIFVSSSRAVSKTARYRFEEKLRLFWELCKGPENPFSFSREEVESYLREYQKQGYPIVRHSEDYRKAYEPAYRVVRKEFEKYLPLYIAVEKCLREKGSATIAIDGNCGAGKSTAARLFASVFDCNVFHTDDFFLPPEKRTPQRMEEVGGNMDRERFRAEICENLRAGKPFSYRPFDCSAMALSDSVEVQPKNVSLIEGSYSMHPELREYYDVTVFLSVHPTLQTARILERNGSVLLRRYVDEWIPMENEYFSKMKVRETCQILL